MTIGICKCLKDIDRKDFYTILSSVQDKLHCLWILIYYFLLFSDKWLRHEFKCPALNSTYLALLFHCKFPTLPCPCIIRFHVASVSGWISILICFFFFHSTIHFLKPFIFCQKTWNRTREAVKIKDKRTTIGEKTEDGGKHKGKKTENRCDLRGRRERQWRANMQKEGRAKMDQGCWHYTK